MGGLSVAAYLVQLEAVGGFLQAYSRGKGGGHAESGYIGEAILLSFPALLVLALSVYAARRRVQIQDFLMAIFIAAPHLVQGVLGGRRGPLFLILSTLLFSWLLASRKRLKIASIMIAVAVIAFAVILIASQRRHLYLGTDDSFDFSRIYAADGLATVDDNATNTYATAVASIAAADYYGDYYWGYRYFVTFFIRPIPKQIWPTKYEDMDATWLNTFKDSPDNTRFLYAVGFAVPAGASTGSIADGYGEFAWGVIVMFFLLGYAFSTSYLLHRREGGFWSIIFMMMLALSIYLPTQSFSAWLHRLLFMSVFAYLFWRSIMRPIRSHGPRQIGPTRRPQLRRY
jgi:oligosaccharide repeat unit polymerase